MPISDYDHWNEEAPIVWTAENDMDSPYCDMTDDEIIQSVFDRMDDDDPDWY
jgi:hypothetical protein